MCKKLLFLAVLLVFVGSACGDITTGLVGHWKMDDGVDSTVADSSGNGNDGTIGGSDTWIEGGGIDFDGGSWGASGIVFANSGADLIADMNLADEATFSYLVTWDVNEYTGTNYPYDGRDVNSVRIFSMECTDSYNMRNFFGGADQYSWNALNDTHEDFIFDEVGKSWGDYIRVTTTIDFNTGIYKLYVDDQVYASGTGKTGSCSGMTTFTIGRTLWGEMEGKMKDFRIYDRALSADDLAELLAGDYSHSPVPGDGADWPHYSTSEVTLEWAAGLSAASHDVYFGTDYNSVADANTESDEFMDNVEVTSYYVDGMSADSTYYWRIDEVNGIDVWEGDVWSFYTEDEWGKPGWILTFHDEFSTGTVPDSNKWKIGSWSSYSYPNYFPSDDPNVYTISNGTLKLHNVIDDYYDPGTETTKHYGAGKLQSDDIFDQAYGYFECSAKLPVGNGSFPAFWMMPEPSGGTWWPNAEIDIMEHVYRDNSIGKIGANMHWNDYDEDHVSWSSLFEGADTYYTFSPTSTAYNDFHVYAVKWEPNEMFFYVDGYNYATFRNDDVPESMYENEPDSYNPADIKAPASTEYLILNNGLAGWVEIDGEGATSTFEIDYVRVYTRDMDYDEPNSNLVCWWQMDQSSGTTVTDTQENMDGTMGNNNYWDANTIYFTGDNYGASGVSSDESIFSGISDEITFAFWAKIDVANTVENGYFFTAKVNGTRVFQIDLSGNESKSLWYKGLGSEVCGVGGIWTPDWGVNPEEFNHYAFTKNATTSEMSLYVNGMLKDRITDANSTFADIDLFEICGASSNWHQWAGNVKDFRIYDKALSDSEIERLSTPIIASEFMPADGQIAEANENSDLTLYWKSGLDAADVNGHRVYFGEDYNSVNDATIISDEYQGTQTANSYDLYSLSDVNTYYWRIDEVNGVDVWKGDTCSFTINHNITFFITSDIHYGRYQVADNEQDNKNLIARMNYMPSKLHYPVELGGELVNRPRAVLAAGDLTDYGEANEWEGYDEYDGFVDDFLGVLNYQLY
ncbi:MAG: family 16 glycosylhydrolase, partial [Planctomycetes bacterium]|nr:family 16 glycosylhydrolase [Planctomycetota bacterium]